MHYEYEPDFHCGSCQPEPVREHRFGISSLEDLHRLHVERPTGDSKLITELITVKRDYAKAVQLLDQHLPMVERLQARLKVLEGKQ
jgi:hypothetical protein